LGNKQRGAVFLQSSLDFPCPVTLGEKSPSFGLHRYRQGLRFIPFDDEGFTLRGDKQRLLYKGRRRSHRFTILGDGSFEYDCILKKEPDNNVIRLRIEGAENYDFFRQPDFVKNPFLQGSYAVYKKETLIGEGTGKLCHIHRPEIIDARGRRCWGTLAVVGNELRITIPEKWLSEALYPVVVDPVVGTTTVGSQNLVEYYPPYDPWKDFDLQFCMGVNRFLVPETINGLCTAYMYTFGDYTYDNDDAAGYPVLYSDNGDYPLTRKSMNEELADFSIYENKPEGWRSSTFMTNEAITSGSYIWFGVLAKLIWKTKYDYGAKIYYGECFNVIFQNLYYGLPLIIPATYPIDDIDWYFDYKLSIYFTYTADYVRTITQGASLTDTRKLAGVYKRLVNLTAGVGSSVSKTILFFRQCVMTLQNTMNIKLFSSMLRKLSETAGLNMKLNSRAYFVKVCSIIESVGAVSRVISSRELYRKIIECLKAVGFLKRHLAVFLRIITNSSVGSYLINRFLKAKIELTIKSPIGGDKKNEELGMRN